ncbi:nucleoside hydrolase [Fodinicola acaciae]|uniref:nucleoside hydrolase n=1 Tax=Fodinicola acaciae TaxID=2681555 RepID=UPI0013D61137|nr:nucleoside hydrolase [Fodinicola acaciae]
MRFNRIFLGISAALSATAIAAAAPATSAPAAPSAAGQKVIFDTDFGQLNDDSQALYLLLQGGADILGVTTVSGNTWAAEGTAYALKQLELVHRQHIPVYQGASDPLLGSRQDKLATEGEMFGKVTYKGAWSRQRPTDYRHLATPPYRGYAHTAKANGSAVDFIVNQVKRNPHQVTLFVLGPATNIALAVKQHPEIVPLVKQVIYMGGAYDVPGNQGPSAEFNVWFDPEASRIALNAAFPQQTIVPLDVTDTVLYGKAQYDRIASAPATPITQEFRDLQGPGFAKDPNKTEYVYDALTSGIFLDPTLVTSASTRKVQVDTVYGYDYGRTLGYQPSLAPTGTQSARVVQRIDVDRFFELYVREMTSPVRH